MRYVREDKFLLCEGFAEQVLNCGIHVAYVVGSHDFLGKLGQQRDWNTVECQVHEEVVFCGEDLGFLFHSESLGARAYGAYR